GDALAVVVEYLHAEALRAAGDGLTDAAKTDDAEGFSPHIGPAVVIEIPALPVPRPDILIGFNDAARDGEHERPSEGGGGLVEDAGSVGDEDAAASAGGNVHVVVANGNVSHDPKLGSSSESVFTDAFGKQADKAFLVFEAAQQFVFGRALLLGPEFAVTHGL